MTTTGYGPPRRGTTSRRGTSPSAPDAPGSRSGRSGLSGLSGLSGPSRRLVIGSVGGAVVTGSLLGLVLGVTNPQGPRPPRATVVQAASNPTSTSAAASNPTVTTGSPTASASMTTAQVTEASPPQERINPRSDRSLRFVRLDDIRRDDQGRIVLQATTMNYVGGKARKAGDKRNEYLLRDDATIYGEYYLGDHTTVRENRFDPNQAYDLLRQALDHGQKPTLWIKRTLRTDGPVIYMAEQYLPDAQPGDGNR